MICLNRLRTNGSTCFHRYYIVLWQTLASYPLGEHPLQLLGHLRSLRRIPQDSPVFFHDGTERPIQRPKDRDAQKAHYSGKKKQHTLKNNLMINAECKVVLLTPSYEGRRHDKRIADATEYRLPKGSVLYQDSGFQGFTLPDINIIQPEKETQKVKNSRLKKKKTIAPFRLYVYALNMLLRASKDTASSKISCETTKKGSPI